jgi:hypothetical protein
MLHVGTQSRAYVSRQYCVSHWLVLFQQSSLSENKDHRSILRSYCKVQVIIISIRSSACFTSETPRRNSYSTVVVFAVWAVAQSCWNQQPFSFSSNRKMNSIGRYWYRPTLSIQKQWSYNSPSRHWAPHASLQWFRFGCEAVFENELTFCSWPHCVRTCTAFAQLAWAAA